MNHSHNKAGWLACIVSMAFLISTQSAIADKPYANLFSSDFSDEYSRRQLISYLINNRQLAYCEDNEDDPNSILIHKIRSQSKLRKQVADAIFIELHCVKRQHDNIHLPVILGRLHEPDYLTALLETLKYSDCCYGPSLIQSLAACASVEYAPILIKTLGKESDGSRGCVQAALLKMTGCLPNQNKTKEDWIAWWNKTFPKKQLEPPSDKYRQLLSDDRIVMIENLRTVMWAIRKYGENPINRFQSGAPTYPNSLDDLIGFEYTSGKKITEEHIDSVRYRKPPNKQASLIPYDFHFLADDSLEISHGFIAVLHGEGRIDLVTADDNADKLELVRLFWPDKWKTPPNVVSHSN